MIYEIHEVDGVEHADIIYRFNEMAPEIFPPLKERHLVDGHWWIAYHNSFPVAFAGVVTFEPMQEYAYFKRCLIEPDHYGHGLQYRLMCLREAKCKQLGYRYIVTDCHKDNHYSERNLRLHGFEPCEPEQKWAGPDALYWIKKLSSAPN